MPGVKGIQVILARLDRRLSGGGADGLEQRSGE